MTLSREARRRIQVAAKPWTTAQDDTFRRMWDKRASIDAIGAAVGKSRNSVASRRKTLGLEPRGPTGPRGGAMSMGLSPLERSRASRVAMATRKANNSGVDPFRRRDQTPDGKWTADEQATLAGLVAQGLSGGQIAKQMGKTRSQVGCRCSRTGLRLLNGKSGPPRIKRGSATHPDGRNNNPTGWNGRVGSTIGTGELPPPQPNVARVSIEKLGARHCRYIGERPELLTIDTPIYCGARTDGGSWCPEHHARMFQPVRARTPEQLERLRYRLK